MQPQQDYYDPSLDGLSQDMQIVLKGKPFKPLHNVKTGNFFSYSFAVAERNKSANADNDIEWIDYNNSKIPKKIRDKTKKVFELHKELVSLHSDLKEAVEDEDKGSVRRIKKSITKMFVDMDELIYPEAEREYVESKEAERYRLEQQGELKLDAASIAALTGAQHTVDVNPGATADASIAQAKLEVAQKRIDELQNALDTQVQGLSEPVKPARKKSVAK